MLRSAFLLLALLLTACGEAIPHDVVTVRAYTDYAGVPTPHPESLGFTYLDDGRGSKYGKPGWNCLLNAVLATDADDDRLVRVIVHELGNVLVLEDGAWPEAMDSTWYVWEGDSQPYHADLSMAEAEWFAGHGPFSVNVADEWLRQPTLEAVTRINVAAGMEVFR